MDFEYIRETVSLFILQKIYTMIFRAIRQIEIQYADSYTPFQFGVILSHLQIRCEQLRQIENLPSVPAGTGFKLYFNIDSGIIIEFQQDIQNPQFLLFIPFPQKRVQQTSSADFLFRYSQNVTEKSLPHNFITKQFLHTVVVFW